MSTNLEQRIIRLEALLQAQAATIRSLQIAAVANAAGINQAQGIQDQWDSSSGSGAPPYICVTPSSGSWAGTAPPTGSPGSFTANVFTLGASGYTAGPTGATILVPYASSPLNSRILTLGKNSDGTYTELGESCS